eukprot:m.204421 g.204421  ORF g.204421 m.204421 type:complete len:780 (+) comp18469_c2_seq1:318-2657(+)
MEDVVVVLDDEDDLTVLQQPSAPAPAAVVLAESQPAASAAAAAAPATPASSRRRQAVACVRCKKSHAANQAVVLTNCQHALGRVCARKSFGGCWLEKACCPACDAAVDWTDLAQVAETSTYCGQAKRFALQREQTYTASCLKCPGCGGKVSRTAAAAKAPTSSDAWLTLKCSGRRSCGAYVCGACGEPHTPPQSTNQVHHGCAAVRLCRFMRLLRDLQTVWSKTNKRRRKTSTKQSAASKTAWSKGTGFGGSAGNSGATAAVQKAQAAEEQRNAQVANILRALVEELRELGADGFTGSGSCAGYKGMLALHATLHTSLLRDVLMALLHNDSLLEITSTQSDLYDALYSFLLAAAEHPLMLGVLNNRDPFRRQFQKQAEADVAVVDVTPGSKRKAARSVPDDGGESDEDDNDDGVSVVDLLRGLNKQVKLFRKQCAKTPGGLEAADPKKLSDRVTVVLESVSRALERLPSYLTQAKAVVLDDETSTSGGQGDSDRQREKDYMVALKPMQFRSVDMDRSLHAYHNDIVASVAAVTKKDRMRRITREISSLSGSLPLTWASSVCVRVDNERPDVLKAMIIGPQGTPYANGCFVFDIFLPAQYPMTPPKVLLRTTGHGRVRFNPNLYACGKVCLSLLGTWAGPGWTVKSTLLQVLLSIQSLIMVEEPYYNEPGFEAAQDKVRSKAYNNILRHHTINTAMLGALRNPDPEFRSAMQLHFSAKKDEILQQCKEWHKDALAGAKTYRHQSGTHQMSYVTPQTMKLAMDELAVMLDTFQVASETIVL